jgi:hypothetical protein
MKREKTGDPEKSVASCKPFLSSMLEEKRLSMVPFPDFLKDENVLFFFTQIFTGIYPQ